MEKSKELTKAQQDKIIYDGLYKEWLDVLSQLWEATGKPVNPAQLKVYAKQLGNIPLGALEAAAEHLLRNHQYNNVPTIGEIWSALRNLFGCNPNDIYKIYDPHIEFMYRFEKPASVLMPEMAQQ